jgi:hypothetical protein
VDTHDPISRSAAVAAPSDRRRAGTLPVISQALKNPPPKKAGVQSRRFNKKGSYEFGGRRRLVVLSGYNPVSNQCLVSVHGGRVLHDDLLLTSVSVVIEALG